MARMLLSLDGVRIKEIVLTKKHTTFGRRPYSDVVIDNLAVSGEHAAVRLLGDDAVIEDLQSTNGTFVNGNPVHSHVLQHGDVVEIGRYQLRFERDDGSVHTQLPSVMNVSRTEPPHPVPLPIDDADRDFDRRPTTFADTTLPGELPLLRPATVTVLSGAAAGRVVQLIKVVTTIGKSGIGIASITRRPHGFSLAHVEGEARPTVNGADVGATPLLLRNGDVIELAGIRMQFAHTLL